MTDVSNAEPEASVASQEGGGARRHSGAIVLISSVGLALAVRAWALHARAVVDFDETYYYILGRNLVTGLGYALNGLPHTAFPPLFPLLVGLTSLLFPDVHVATSLVSAAAGALLPVPVYFLAKEIYGRRAAAFAAFAAAVWPALFFFAMVSVSYPSQMYFGSEPLYVTVIAAGMLFIYRLARRGGWRNAILAGAFFGLASLVRNEGPVVFAFLFLWLVAALALSRRLWKPRGALQAALAAAAMLAVLSPFLVYIHRVTGQWTLGAKLANNARIRDTLWDWVVLDNNEPFLRCHYAVNPEWTHMADPYWGVSDWHRANMREAGSISGGLGLIERPDWRWLGVFARAFHGAPVPIVPGVAWLLVVLGLFFGPWDRSRFVWWTFAAAAVAPMLLLAVSLYVLPRHELPLVVLFAVAFGKGADGLGRCLAALAAGTMRRDSALSRSLAVAPGLLACLLMLASGIGLNRRGNVVDGASAAASAHDMRALAANLKDRLPAGATLMSNEPWLALWAGLEWRVAPMASPAQFAAYARARRVDFALLRPWHFTERENTAALEPFYAARIDHGGPWFLFDFRPSHAAAPQ
jgi:4-amino-4-deoxy-L-arabinose transferase-like glycosyltransferase